MAENVNCKVKTTTIILNRASRDIDNETVLI